jgi:glycerophosphoryl diester phosphodiesterase
MPKVYKTSEMSIFKKYYFAHRGLHKDNTVSPENSMAAFALAVENNYGIELDVQLTKDKVPVVFHDYSLRRVCGIDRKVNDLSYNELRELRLYSSDEKIPHISEVLELVKGKVPLIIELKMGTLDISLCGIILPFLDKYKGDYCIESFNPFGLKYFKKHRPDIIRGQLSSDFNSDGDSGNKLLYFALKNLLLNFLSKPDFIAYSYKHKGVLSYVLCKRIYSPITIGWTIDSQEALYDCRNDFDIFIFEDFIPKE